MPIINFNSAVLEVGQGNARGNSWMSKFAGTTGHPAHRKAVNQGRTWNLLVLILSSDFLSLFQIIFLASALPLMGSGPAHHSG